LRTAQKLVDCGSVRLGGPPVLIRCDIEHPYFSCCGDPRSLAAAW
jgi:hypothetical protein